MSPPEAGDRFGDYVLLDKIAQGGMAELFIAKRRGVEGFEKTVAIKRILPELSLNRDFVSMFINEAKIAARLSHPNIVQIFDFGKIDNYYFIAMEYVHGENLRAILGQAAEKKVAIKPEIASLIIAGACAGLEHAHKKADESGRALGIVHRDVSPQNVLVTYDGDIKVVDFGIAKAVAENPEATRGVLKGKLAYLSPEQVYAKNLDARSDVFSAGLVLYELVSGKKLFAMRDAAAILDAIVHIDSTEVSRSVSGLDRPLREVLRRALAVDPDQRFASAGEMQLALEEYVRERGEASQTTQLAGLMRLLFDQQIGDRTRQALHDAVTGRSKPRRARVRHLRPRLLAALVGAAAAIVALIIAAPRLRASAPPPDARETTVAPAQRKAAPIDVKALVEDGKRQLDSDSDAAAERFRAAVLADPNLFEPHFYLAKIYTAKSDPQAAVHEYDEAIRIDPKSADAQFNLGFVYFSQRRYDDALRQYEKALKLKPAADIYYNVSACFEQMKRRSDAIATLKRGIAAFPDSELLRARLKQLGD